jgi:prepilin-type N-terminal cleavage/methylation domain-containing protein
MKQTKVKAFTLAEMLVVLVVASIVISMGFLVLNMVRKQVKLIQNAYHKKQEMQFFETTFSRDIHTHQASYNEKESILTLSNTKEVLTYRFLKEAVVREKDSFFIEIATKKLFLNGKEVTEKTIDAIEINFSNQFASKQLFIHKVKDASYYMNF